MGKISRRECTQSVASLAAAGLVATTPAAALAKTCEGVRHPDAVTVQGKKLVLNGVGIREATFLKVDVYVAGLYLEKRSKDGEAIARSEQVKHIVLKFVRDVDRDDMAEAIADGFKKNAGGKLSALKPLIAQFSKYLPNIKSGFVLAFTYVPQKGLIVSVQGRTRGTINGKSFSDVFFRIWLGPSPPNSGLKRGLLGGKC